MEMSVVITLLALFAALIVPNVAAEKAGREARQFFSKARNLMLEAKARSMADGQTRTIRIDDTGGQLIVERVNQEDGEASQDKSLALPEGVTSSAFRAEKDESTSAEWDIRFYSDGKAKAGGISFSNNDRIISLAVDENGRVQVIEGPLPDLTNEKWDAGGFEQRV